MAKLSDRQRKQIIAEYVNGGGAVSQRTLAARYHVTQKTISKILNAPDVLDKVREENKMLRLQMFAFVRNSVILPVGVHMHKSEQEITDKTFETIEAAKNMLDIEAIKVVMNLASKKENRFDNAD